MVMNYITKMYLGMVFRMSSMTAHWDEEKPEPEDELRQMLDEVKAKVESIKSVVEEQNAIIESDFQSQLDDEANGLARQRRDV